MNAELTWTGSPDDQKCRIGDYLLRVEDMGDYYWWAMYFEEEYEDYGYLPTIEAAKTACEKAYKHHLKTR